MADRAELLRAIDLADKAGDAAAVEEIAGMLEAMDAQAPAPTPQPTQGTEDTFRQAFGIQETGAGPNEAFSMPSPGAVLRAGGQLISGSVGEVLGGASGALMLPLGADRAAQQVQGTRDLFSVPQTPESAAILQPVADTMGQFFDWYNEVFADPLGERSPFLGALTQGALPAALEAIGLKQAKSTLARSNTPPKRVVRGNVLGNAPSAKKIKADADGIYKKLENSGVQIKQGEFAKFMARVHNRAVRMGAVNSTAPKSLDALRKLGEHLGKDVDFIDFDTARQIAREASDSLDSVGAPTKDAAVGSMILDQMDDFLDNATVPKQFKADYDTARALWGRYRRSEIMSRAFKRADRQASGLENGLRAQLRNIANNDKLMAKYNPREQQLIDRVVKGGKIDNIYRFLGKFGVDPTSAINQQLMPFLTGAGVGYVFGPESAVALLGIGVVSKKMAARLTERNFQLADAIVRAGGNAERITQAYLRNAKKRGGSHKDLAQLLADPKVDLADLERLGPFAQRSKELALRIRQALVTAAVAAAQGQAQQEQPQLP